MRIGIDLHISQNISSNPSGLMPISYGHCRTQNSILIGTLYRISVRLLYFCRSHMNPKIMLAILAKRVPAPKKNHSWKDLDLETASDNVLVWLAQHSEI